MFCLTRVAGTAEVKLPAIFGDHMVLQRDQPVALWGRARAGERVTVEIRDQRVETTAGADGRWSLKLAPLAASDTPVELTVTGGNKVVLRDVLVGDVWVCGGQSNMGLGVGAMREAKAITAGANRPLLRLFAVKRQVSFEGREDCEGAWVVCTPESVLQTGGAKGFSAVGYQFGAELQAHLGLPVGLIGCYVGGSNIVAWSNLSSLKAMPAAMTYTASRVKGFYKAREDLPADLLRYEKELLPAWEKERAEQQRPLDQWRKDAALAHEQNKPVPVRPELVGLSKHPQSPDQDFSHASVLFNGMVRPLIPFGIRGVIWYQGESNAYPVMTGEYAALFSGLITDWRARWGNAALPFLFVQLPNLETEKDTWPLVREAQRSVLTLPATGMAVAIDAGNPKDLHPADKTLVAHRLFLAARGIAYGEAGVFSGPLYSSLKADGKGLRVGFEHTGGGLVIAGTPSPWFDPESVKPAEHVQGFEVAGDDGVFHTAQAEIDGAGVRVWSDAVAAPKAVRYAWAPNPRPFPNLYNLEGLPTAPFHAKLDH